MICELFILNVLVLVKLSSYRVINSETSSCKMGFAAQLRQKLWVLHLDLCPLLTEETHSERKDEQLNVFSVRYILELLIRTKISLTFGAFSHLGISS